MALINIEYGSIASSATMNNNFSYLEEKINDSNTQINSSISSILSNIATINSRLTEISESLTSSVATLESTISDNKTKTKLLVKNSGMVPNWGSCASITLTSGTPYTAEYNGYVLLLPSSSSSGSITIEEKTMTFKARSNSYDNASELVVLPVKAGNTVSTTVSFSAAYFVPAAEISVEDF